MDRRLLVAIGTLGLLIAACSTGSSSPGASTAASDAPTAAPPSAAVESAAASAEASASGDAYVNEVVPGSGAGLKVGYISGGESVPFVKTVSDSIKEQADIAGLELVSCDAQIKAAEALKCAQSFAVQGLKAVANWQFIADSAPAVCEAYGNLPTVSIDVPEPPCQKVFTGIDNEGAGTLLGTELGKYIKDKFDCKYDYYWSGDAPTQPDINRMRMGTTKSAFEAICGPVPPEKYVSDDIGSGQGANISTTENVRRQFADFLTTAPDARVIVVPTLNDDALLGVMAAAKTAGRIDDVYGGAHGGDNSSWEEIRTNPHWVVDAAYTPERYGEVVVPALVALAKGLSVPEKVLLQPTALTAANIDQLYPKP